VKIFDLFRREKITARYEAGVTFTPDRSWLPAYVQGADQDIEHDRLEMVRKARYFEKNSALVQKILDLIETNVVGAGINPTPMAEGDEWCAKALVQWDEWCRFADVGSRQHFYSVQALLARAQAVDGEVFVELLMEGARPRIRLWETHQIEDIAIGSFGRVEGYWVTDGRKRRYVPIGLDGPCF
jgi:capsid protein